MIRRVTMIVLLAVVAAIVLWNADANRTPESTCSQVSVSHTEQAAHVGTSIGDMLYRLKTDAKAWGEAEVDRAVHHAGTFWRLAWAGVKLAAKVGKLRADKAVTGMVPFKEIDCAQVAAAACPPGGPPGGTHPPVDSIPASWTLSGDALAADALRRAGFPAAAIPEGVAVARLESSDVPGVVGPHAGGGVMRGMWQMNDRYYSDPRWANPYVNARLALRAWHDGGNSWRLWSTHQAAEQQLGQGARSADPPGPGAPAPRGCVTGAALGGGPVPASFASLNPRSPEQAIAWLSGLVGKPIAEGACLHYVSEAYGHRGTTAVFGRHWAVDVFTTMPARYVGTGDPPRGALVFWRTSNAAGHIALSLGGGKVLSTDYPRPGTVGVAPLSDIDQWGTRVGWSAPYFTQRSI
jgi:hypothetical protein